MLSTDFARSSVDRTVFSASVPSAVCGVRSCGTWFGRRRAAAVPVSGGACFGFRLRLRLGGLRSAAAGAASPAPAAAAAPARAPGASRDGRRLDHARGGGGTSRFGRSTGALAFTVAAHADARHQPAEQRDSEQQLFHVSNGASNPARWPGCALLNTVRSCLRKHQSKPSAAPWRGLHFDLAVVQLDDAVDHRETDAAALLLRREIQVEDPLQMLRRNADAGVFDVELDAFPRDRTTGEPQRPAVAASPDRR